VTSPTQRPVPDNTQQSQETNFHDPGGFRTRIPKNQGPQALILYRAATGIGKRRALAHKIKPGIILWNIWQSQFVIVTRQIWKHVTWRYAYNQLGVQPYPITACLLHLLCESVYIGTELYTKMRLSCVTNGMVCISKGHKSEIIYNGYYSLPHIVAVA